MDWPDEQYAAQDDPQTTVVGLMSDTHGVLDKRVLQAFRDAKVDYILHAGARSRHSTTTTHLRTLQSQQSQSELRTADLAGICLYLATAPCFSPCPKCLCA